MKGQGDPGRAFWTVQPQGDVASRTRNRQVAHVIDRRAGWTAGRASGDLVASAFDRNVSKTRLSTTRLNQWSKKRMYNIHFKTIPSGSFSFAYNFHGSYSILK
jgi:hypothetical protein